MKDLIIAVLLAVVFAVAADFLRVGSRSRVLLRRWNNYRAEQSLEKLERRVAELQDEREQEQDELAHDRAYLRSRIGTLITMLCLMSWGLVLHIAAPYLNELTRVHPHFLRLSLGGWIDYLACLSFLASGIHMWRFYPLSMKMEKYVAQRSIENLNKEIAKLDALIMDRIRRIK